MSRANELAREVNLAIVNPTGSAVRARVALSELEWLAVLGLRYKPIVEAATALYERVEMDESVGICLSERVEALQLGRALAGLEEPT